MRAARPSFGTRLRELRQGRRLTQTALAELCRVSQRHLSFVESGRAYPSRELVLRAGAVLDAPLAQRNELLALAGFAPMYRRRALADDEMTAVRRIVAHLLAAHEPFPALAVDAHWNLLLANEPARRLLGGLVDVDALVAARARGPLANVIHLTFHPAGLSRAIVNWPQVGTVLYARLRCAAATDPALAALAAEVAPWVPAADPAGDVAAPLLPTRWRIGTDEVDTLSTITSFGSAQDMLAADIHIEMLFPASAHDESRLRALVAPR